MPSPTPTARVFDMTRLTIPVMACCVLLKWGEGRCYTLARRLHRCRIWLMQRIGRTDDGQLLQ